MAVAALRVTGGWQYTLWRPQYAPLDLALGGFETTVRRVYLILNSRSVSPEFAILLFGR